MKRVQGTKGVSLFECINADQNKWNVRWDVQDNPADKDGKVKGINYMEETFPFKPDLTDVKSVMSIWCSGEEAVGSFVLDAKNITLERSGILLLRSQAEQAVKEGAASMPLITDDGVVEVAPIEALFVAGRILANYGDCHKNITDQLEAISQAGSIEVLTAINFQEGYPVPVSMTLEEVRAAIVSEKKTPEQQAVLFARMTINNTDLTNTDALTVKELHPEWNDFIGKPLKAKFRVQYDGHLYRVRQDIATVLKNQPPGIDTAALYEEINEDHAGTQDDPIPYNNNMELFSGKYYSQNGITYHCTRDTGQAVYQDLSALVGIYVEKVE
jgi:hypothetical protein